MEALIDDLVAAAGPLAGSLLDHVRRADPELIGQVDAVLEAGGALEVAVRFGTGSVAVVLVVHAPDGRTFDLATVARSIGGGTAH